MTATPRDVPGQWKWPLREVGPNAPVRRSRTRA